MSLLKKLLYAFALFLGGVQMHLFAQSPNNVIDEVIWVVGDEAILRSEVEAARMDFGANISGNPYCVIPEQLAIQKLFLHQAQLDSIEVEASEVTANVEGRLNELIMRAGSKEKLEEYYHKTMTQIREMMFESIKEQYVVQKVRAKLTSDIKVTPAEVRRYFKDMPEDSLPWIPAQVEVQIITQQPFIPQEEIERVKAELRDYTDRVNKRNPLFLHWLFCIRRIPVLPVLAVKWIIWDVQSLTRLLPMWPSVCPIPQRYPRWWSRNLAFISFSW